MGGSLPMPTGYHHRFDMRELYCLPTIHKRGLHPNAVDDWLMTFADDEKLPLFNCSPGFIQAFRNRNRFSLRHRHFKRRRAAAQEAQSR
jgi:hypothetical protein